MKIQKQLLALALLPVAAWSCSTPQTEEAEETAAATEEVTYVATLEPLNSNVTGLETSGHAHFMVSGDTMTVMITVMNAPAGIEHWQHFHGFINSDEAAAATMAQDANGDGIVDVVETEPVSGTTMVPFNAIPSAMNLPDSSYPVADENGIYSYEAKIPLSELNKAFADAFDGAAVQLDKRVLYIHGVPADTKLPETVATVHDIPAHITLPIAVGKITKAE